MVNFIRKRLQVFVSSTFSDLVQERQAAVEALSQFSRRDDLVGWVPDTQANTPALADKIARLSEENAQLRNQIKDTKDDIIVNRLTFSKIIEVPKNDQQQLISNPYIEQYKYDGLYISNLVLCGIVKSDINLPLI